VNLPNRFVGKVDMGTGSGCWLWTAYITRDGYGRLKVDGRMVLAHRYSFEAAHGAIPAGLVMDHLCRVRRCVNPDHLRAVTQRENVYARGSLALTKRHAQRTTCPRGHAHASWNAVGYHVRRGERKCLACHRAQAWGQRRGYDSLSPLVVAESHRRFQVLETEAHCHLSGDGDYMGIALVDSPATVIAEVAA
jgi:hypothetical protein